MVESHIGSTGLMNRIIGINRAEASKSFVPLVCTKASSSASHWRLSETSAVRGSPAVRLVSFESAASIASSVLVRSGAASGCGPGPVGGFWRVGCSFDSAMASLSQRSRQKRASFGPRGLGPRALRIPPSLAFRARGAKFPFDVPTAVLAFIAKTVTHNGRDLDGALNRLLAHNKLTGHPVTMEMAECAVRDLVRPQDPKRVKIEDIQRTVARQYNVSRADLLSSRRTANVVRPRQIAMYLAKTLTLRSLPEIGRRFGGRDHTTVLHAVRKIETLVGSDTALADEIELLKRLLQE